MKLSVIIPAYNVEGFIESTLQSLNNQSSKDFEIIVIDDGSTDKTNYITRQMLSVVKCKAYKVIEKENGGVSSARNMGLINAKGEYVVFLDGDDFVSADFVETIINAVSKDQESEMFCWGYDLVNTNNVIISNYFDKFKDLQYVIDGIEALRLKTNDDLNIWTGSVAYKKDFLSTYELNFTEGCINGEDQEFIIKCLSRASKVNFLNKVLSFYLIRENSITNIFNFNKFDSVKASIRTYQYLECLNSESLLNVINTIKYDKTIKNYLGNINNCLRYYNANTHRKRENILMVLDQVDREYADLNEEVKKIMKSYKGSNIRLKLISILFLMSPALYSHAIYLRDKITNEA